MEGFLYFIEMKYFFLAIICGIAVNVQGQTADSLHRTPEGAFYKILSNQPGDKIKLNDVVTFNFIQKTDKDSVLFDSFQAGTPGMDQVKTPKEARDPIEQNLFEIFPSLAVKDSLLLKISTDTLFKGHEDHRPAFLPKGSFMNFMVKIEKVESMSQAIAERDSAMAKMKAEQAEEAAKAKAQETAEAANYIAAHKLVLKTTPSGLKYVITHFTTGKRPLKGDTLLVNYTGRTLTDSVFDSSIDSIAKKANLDQPGRTYEPISVVVGEGNVIPGWDEGLLLLRQGERAKFVIPSKLAYGEQGAGNGVIKPYSTLVFDVQIVKIKPIKHLPPAGSKKPAAHKAKVYRKPVHKS